LAALLWIRVPAPLLVVCRFASSAVRQRDAFSLHLARRFTGTRATDDNSAQCSVSKHRIEIWLNVCAVDRRRTAPTASVATKDGCRSGPRKRKGLVAYLDTRFAKKIPEAELQKLVDRIIEEKKIGEVNGALAYQL
jgi:hypothetical protein